MKPLHPSVLAQFPERHPALRLADRLAAATLPACILLLTYVAAGVWFGPGH